MLKLAIVYDRGSSFNIFCYTLRFNAQFNLNGSYWNNVEIFLVCIKFLSTFEKELTNDDRKKEASIEDKLRKFCAKSKNKEERFVSNVMFFEILLSFEIVLDIKKIFPLLSSFKNKIFKMNYIIEVLNKFRPTFFMSCGNSHKVTQSFEP